MNNNITLTDNELCLIQTSLMITIASHEKYILANGDTNLDVTTIETIKGMKQLRDKLLRDHF